MGLGAFNPGCTCCCPIAWTFTDEGFIAGGQDGALREYENPADVIYSPWQIIDDCLGLRCDFEDSADDKRRNETTEHLVDEDTADNSDYTGDPQTPPGAPGCSNYNPLRQIATAEGTITVPDGQYIQIDFSGQGEQEDVGFENMTVSVWDETGTTLVDSASATSPGGQYGCDEMAPVIDASTLATPVTIYIGPLAADDYLIRVSCDTADSWFHVNAYYQFEFAISNGPP